MCHSKSESLHFYKYLCLKIGSEEIIRARRLLYLCRDLRTNKLGPQITSGSKAEGLHLKGSDLDLMFLNPNFVVYESEKDYVQNDRRIVLIMDTEDTPPCFTHLRLRANCKCSCLCLTQLLQQHRGEKLFSSELCKSHALNILTGFMDPRLNTIHGPCISDCDGQLDVAHCIKCDQWVSQSQPWIYRPRSIWPSPELISKITSCGVLFVPIGYKGSINENLQWRISFSVAEKILIHSFSHTQLLCYALLKILLKEIIERNHNLKGLLCSYFLKTLMFWISEEIETSFWRPDNIIPCFMACLQRLIYCIDYSTLLHYFIPENNLLYLRFNRKNRNTLINILKNCYQTGIQMFSSSETLHDYIRFPCEIIRSVCENTTLVKTILEYEFHRFEPPIINIVAMHTLLRHCKTELSRCLLAWSIAIAYQRIPLTLPHINNPNNKQQYRFYKHALSQLLVGLHSDVISGWLKLASFFYVHKKYLTSIDIINHTLSKCTDKSSVPNITLKRTQNLKLILQVTSLTIPFVTFEKQSSVIPIELEFDVRNMAIFFKSIPCAYFLRFLCCYHLQDLRSCCFSRTQLFTTILGDYFSNGETHNDTTVLISVGIACQMLGETNKAKKYFRFAAERDEYNITSAAFRLRQL